MVQITKNTFGNGCVVIWAVMESGCDLLKKFALVFCLLKFHPPQEVP